MIKSMTGFGRATKEENGYSVTVEIKAVNHRFCEQIIRIPRKYIEWEEQIKKVISKTIQRGRMEVFISIEDKEKKQQRLVVDWEMLDQYQKLLQEMKTRYKIEQPISFQDILQYEDCFEIIEEDEVQDQIKEIVFSTVQEAVRHLQKMRQKEGEATEKDLLLFLSKIEEERKHLLELAPQIISEYQEKMKRKIETYIQDDMDEGRLLTEVAILCDKSDVNEELVRLESHVQQFYQMIASDGPIGRKLDFLLQEMNREVNTIGSKTNAANIGVCVVNLKSYLEKIKEQVQNIE